MKPEDLAALIGDLADQFEELNKALKKLNEPYKDHNDALRSIGESNA